MAATAGSAGAIPARRRVTWPHVRVVRRVHPLSFPRRSRVIDPVALIPAPGASEKAPLDLGAAPMPPGGATTCHGCWWMTPLTERDTHRRPASRDTSLPRHPLQRTVLLERPRGEVASARLEPGSRGGTNGATTAGSRGAGPCGPRRRPRPGDEAAPGEDDARRAASPRWQWNISSPREPLALPSDTPTNLGPRAPPHQPSDLRCSWNPSPAGRGGAASRHDVPG